MFHGSLVLALSPILSPWNWGAVYLSLCTVSNHVRHLKPPGFIAHRYFYPIDYIPDDCLLRDYPVDLPFRDGTPASELDGIPDRQAG